ncbi:MAG: hypothetical protein H7255_08125 [Ramlibacter sp.]|nr:hypothetical protein [Ramlibacter sp.]
MNKITTNRPPKHDASPAGKSQNDVNKVGHQAPTQKNEGRRTPESRSDRESKIGGNNQSQSRRSA